MFNKIYFDSKKIITLALIIRVLLMPFFFHPDIKTYHFQASFLQEGVFDIYSYLKKNQENLPLKEEFVYFPLTYFILGGYQVLLSPLLGSDFYGWLSDASMQSIERPGFYRYLFLLKLPYLILDFAIAFLLMNYFKDKKDRQKALLLWLFNPFSLILIYIFSNVDIFPVLLTAASVVLIQREKKLWSSFLLGLGSGFKAYPLLLLPFLTVYAKKSTDKVLIAGICLGTLLLIILSFIKTEAFRDSALISGLTTRIISLGVNIGFGEVLMPAIVVISVLFFTALKERVPTPSLLIRYYLALLLIVFSFIHYHIQWLLWVMPFVILVMVEDRRLMTHLLILLLLAFAVPFLYDDGFMSVSLLRPVSPLYDSLSTPFMVVRRVYDPYIIQSVIHSFFLGGSLLLSWRMFKSQV